MSNRRPVLACRRKPRSSPSLFRSKVSRVPQAFLAAKRKAHIDFWRAANPQQFHAAIDILCNAIKAGRFVWSGQGLFCVLWVPGLFTRSSSSTGTLSGRIGEPQFSYSAGTVHRRELDGRGPRAGAGYSKRYDTASATEHCRKSGDDT